MRCALAVLKSDLECDVELCPVSGTTLTSYQFTSQRNDAAIGLYFYNARYYDPALGRFIQADTIVLQSRYYPARG